MYLVDTNVWLEIILDLDKSDEAKHFLKSADASHLNITDFSFYSIGIFLLRSKKHDAFLRFVEETFTQVGVTLVRLNVTDMYKLVQAGQRFNLDFDDAYQYAVAEKFDLQIVTFDADFDRTERGRRTPSEVGEKGKDGSPSL